MLQHQGAILRGVIKKKYYKYNMYLSARRTWPFYVFDSDMEALVNVGRDVRYGLVRDNNPVGTKSSRIVPASWRIYKTSRSFQSSTDKLWELIAHV